MIALTHVMKAAFSFVFGLHLDTLPPVEDEQSALDGTPRARFEGLPDEWEAIGFPQPYFSLTGQVPAHVMLSWR